MLDRMKEFLIFDFDFTTSVVKSHKFVSFCVMKSSYMGGNRTNVGGNRRRDIHKQHAVLAMPGMGIGVIILHTCLGLAMSFPSLPAFIVPSSSSSFSSLCISSRLRTRTCIYVIPPKDSPYKSVDDEPNPLPSGYDVSRKGL